MKIRTQFIVTTIAFGIILLVISASYVIIDRRMIRLAQQQEIAINIERAASELSYLSNDYLLFHEGQQRVRWETKFASFSEYLSKLNPYSAEQQALVSNMKGNQQRLQAVFASVASALEGTSQTQDAEALGALVQVSWSRMAVQNQGIIFDALRLSEMLRDQADRTRETRRVLIFTLIGAFGSFVLASYVLNYRRTLRSLSTLQAGTEIIGSGNLDFTITEKRNDEIGDLSRSFNRMTASLRDVTASKAEMEREIDQRKHAEQQIVHLASFPELNPNPVLELDAAGDITYLNPASKTLFPDLPVQRSQHPFLANWEAMAGTLRSEDAHLLTREIKVANSWYEQTVVYLPSTRNFRLYGRDVTERKQAEEQLKQSNVELEASNKELEAFSYSVSHDLRAPLRSMEGFSEALIEDYGNVLDEQGRDYLRRIQDSSHVMAQLIDDLLGLSRVTRGEMHWDIVDLSELAERIIAERRQAEPSRAVRFAVRPGLTTRGDRQLLALVLQNLLANAWKFTSNRPDASIEVGLAEHDGRTAYFVRDNGAGFDMAYAGKLFQPFQRLHKASEYSGTGIGLATVQRIIRRHGGHVWAEGDVGKGATFYFTLAS